MLEPASTPDAKIRRRRLRFAAAFAVLLLLAIFAPPFININRFRHSIVDSISAGLGRPVHASAVELTLFPRPAFVLHQLTVAEDAAYGAEPVLTADTVTASLRASTLWHQRVEIATLHFDAPSLNLVRNAQGHWSFESLLHHFPTRPSAAAHVPPAHTPPPFPYVEATEARINFKQGPEKLPFSLEGADLAVWKESRNTWRMRIRARPVRTDLTVADTGEIRGEGTVQVAGSMEDSPVRLSVEWRHVQLGEISRLLHGEDEGWRGTVDWTADAHGTLARTLLTTDVQVEEFRRAEFVPPGEMDGSAHCQTRYLHAQAAFDSLQCNLPLGTGHLFVESQGPLQLRPAPPGPLVAPASLIQIGLQHVPAEFFLDLFRHVHPGVTADATATGEINGEANCDWQGTGHLTAGLQTCAGEIRSTALRVDLPALTRPLRVSPLLLAPAQPLPASSRARRKATPPDVPVESFSASSSAAPGWTLAPSHLWLGAAAPATAAAPVTAAAPLTLTGMLTPTGSTLKLTGAADLTQLFELAQALRIPALSNEIHSIRGSGQLGISLATQWLPQPTNSDLPGRQFSPALWGGSVQLHNATLTLASLPGSVDLTSGVINILPATPGNSRGVEWTHLTGTYAHTSFDGSLRWPIQCVAPADACARSFTLHTPNLNAARLATAFRHGNASSELLDLVNPWAGNLPPVPEISGTLSADTLSAGRIVMKNAVLGLTVQGQRAELTAISGNIFGGTIHGLAETTSGAALELIAPRRIASVGSAQWGKGAPIYTLHASLQHIQPDNVAAIWREHWGWGVAGAEIDVTTQGWSAAELAQNATGSFSMDWRNGTLATSAGNASAQQSALAPAKFQQFAMEGIVGKETLVLGSGKIIGFSGVPTQKIQGSGHAQTPSSQSVTGTVTFGRTLDLQLQPSDISITGPLNTPVATMPATTSTGNPTQP